MSTKTRRKPDMVRSKERLKLRAAILEAQERRQAAAAKEKELRQKLRAL